MNCDALEITPCVPTSNTPTLLMGTFLSWNCHGIRSKLKDLKGLISIFNPVCMGLQEIFLSSTIPIKLRGYNSVPKDTATGSNHSGGVCILTSNLYPSTPLTLHTSLQAVAVQDHARTLVTVCSVYLPPHDVISQQDLDTLMDQLPTPFILSSGGKQVILHSSAKNSSESNVSV
ncbi:hypothetical protein AVEN_151172-1 [Araneus ventricosus]|uniref:Endonuclease/exonuclease/phosphatase domain-containing protein n=1 Tax=Araneus ventricosus TaxID=182803 RepID=A0A4Y2MRQ7_ARAVE|nr:hypothetical protein AVEN_151172-1 [Araneus ventricosus]